MVKFLIMTHTIINISIIYKQNKNTQKKKLIAMYRRIIGYSTLAVLGGCLLAPDQYYPGQLKPINHMLNVAKAGIQMAYVYKFNKDVDIRQKHEEASMYLCEGLRKNGGIYIKLGQLIATLDVIVPDEYRRSMMSLTRGCEKSSFDSVKWTIEQELGKPLEQIFQKFDKQPVSSASIGQVHKATLRNGEQVAVKVQHANLAQNVYYDLKLMRGFVQIAKWLFKDFKYVWLVEQFDKNIHRELDFQAEAANIRRVQTLLKGEKYKNVSVPKIMLPPTKKLLVMEYIHGVHIDELEAIKAKGINAREMGKTFSEVIVKMIHKYGFVHADPHSGNILLRKNKKGKDQLVLLDHGLYQELDEAARMDYNRFWLGMILNKEQMIIEAANQLGTKNGILLCCMLTSQTRDELSSPDRHIFDLNPNTDQAVVLRHATQWQQEIVQVLNELRREILLLLKVNQFARTIENMLGGRQMGVYEDIARNCVENLPLSRCEKWRIYWQMFWAKRRR